MHTDNARNVCLADRFYDSLRMAFGGASQFGEDDVGAALYGNHNNHGRYHDVSIEDIAEVIARQWDEDKDLVAARIKSGYEARKKLIQNP